MRSWRERERRHSSVHAENGREESRGSCLAIKHSRETGAGRRMNGGSLKREIEKRRREREVGINKSNC